MTRISWNKVQGLHWQSFRCGHCGELGVVTSGYTSANSQSVIVICPGCTKPTFVQNRGQPDESRLPDERHGATLTSAVPAALRALYDEAQLSASIGAYTGAVMLCRKMLMNFAVEHKATEGLRFVEYVDFIQQGGFMSKANDLMLTYIKDRGNEANHEITAKGREEAAAVLRFVGELLHHNYELPAMVPAT